MAHTIPWLVRYDVDAAMGFAQEIIQFVEVVAFPPVVVVSIGAVSSRVPAGGLRCASRDAPLSPGQVVVEGVEEVEEEQHLMEVEY